jgi:hypothetical protein
MAEHTRAHWHTGRFVISSDGAVLGPGGAVFLAADDPRNPGNLILDSLGNVVDPMSGSVVAAVAGFAPTATVTQPPSPEPIDIPLPLEEPGNGGEKPEGEQAELALWRAVALGSRSGQPVRVTRRPRRQRYERPAVDDGGFVDV